MKDMDLIATRGLQSQVQHVCHILSPHVRAELPRNDVTAEIVQSRAEVEPAPADDHKIDEIGLLEFVDRDRLPR